MQGRGMAVRHAAPRLRLHLLPFHLGSSSSTPVWRVQRCLHTAATSSSNSDTTDANQQHELVTWVLSRGGSVNGVAPANLAGRDGASGWGLKAVQDLTPGQRLVELPAGCQLSYSPATTPGPLMALIEQVPPELWGGRLGLQVLAERLAGESSPFAPYITNLPLGVSGVPLFFPEAAIAALEYPPVVEQVKKRGRWLARFCRDSLAALPGGVDPFEGANVDVNALGWALAVVSSRAFRLRGLSQPASLLPLIDMANHSFTANAEVVLAGDTAVMRATRQVAAGEPLLLNYGALGNDFLLMDYGFIIPGNPNDRVALRFDLDLLESGAAVTVVKEGGDLWRPKLTPWKRQVLTQLNLMGDKPNLQVTIGGQPPVSPRLLAGTRIVAAQYASEAEGKTLEAMGDWERPWSREHEDRVLRILIGCCFGALSRFSTSLEEDAWLLEAGRALAAGQEPPPPPPSPAAPDTATTTAASSQQQETPKQQQQQQQSAATPSSPQQDVGSRVVGGLTAQQVGASEELQLALRYRSELKRVLIEALQSLSRRVKEVAAMKDLKQAAVVPLKKGQKPRPATKAGFGK